MPLPFGGGQLSRSYKKHPVCTSHQSYKEIQQMYNRRFRRKAKQGFYDDVSFGKSNQYRKLENFTYVVDRYKWYETLEHTLKEYEAKKILRTSKYHYYLSRRTAEEVTSNWYTYYHRK